MRSPWQQHQAGVANEKIRQRLENQRWKLEKQRRELEYGRGHGGYSNDNKDTGCFAGFSRFGSKAKIGFCTALFRAVVLLIAFYFIVAVIATLTGQAV